VLRGINVFMIFFISGLDTRSFIPNSAQSSDIPERRTPFMARKFELSVGKYAWNFDRCEEILVITGYNEILRFIAPDHTLWSRDFERLFYDQGTPLGFYLIERINEVRKRKNLKALTFRETDVSEYGRVTDRSERAKARRALRDQISELDPKGLAVMIDKATIATEALSPPHLTLEELKAKRKKTDQETQISRAAAGLLLAQQKAEKDRAAAENRMARIEKMLTLATAQSLRDQIVASLSPEEALDMAGRVDDFDLRDQLVRHSMSSFAV
jgi:hypothetical protein